jgi:hypothetical protein
MNDVIARLRQSKKGCDQAAYQHGRNIGCRWAQKYAAYDELHRLANHFDYLPPLEAEMLFAPMARCYSGAQLLHAIIIGVKEPEGEKSEWFWDAALGNDSSKANHPEFLRGFVEGALDVWTEVNGEL